MKAVTHTTHGSVLDNLGLSSVEADNLKLRAQLMREVEKYIQDHHLTQMQAASCLGISQPRVNNLLRGKINLFTIDALVKMLSKVNIHIFIMIDTQEVA
jgi:predicted XRE-type DNA-binding protein